MRFRHSEIKLKLNRFKYLSEYSYFVVTNNLAQNKTNPSVTDYPECTRCSHEPPTTYQRDLTYINTLEILSGISSKD